MHNFQLKKKTYFFLFLHENICRGYSLEAPWRGTSVEPHNICFRGEIRKNSKWIPHFIWSCGRSKLWPLCEKGAFGAFAGQRRPRSACTSTSLIRAVIVGLQSHRNGIAEFTDDVQESLKWGCGFASWSEASPKTPFRMVLPKFS